MRPSVVINRLIWKKWKLFGYEMESTQEETKLFYIQPVAGLSHDLKKAAQEKVNFHNLVIDAVKENTVTGAWPSPAFEFARTIKSYPGMAQVDPYDALKTVKSVLRYDGYPPLEYILERFFAFQSVDEFEADFVHSYTRVRCLKGEPVLKQLAKVACEHPIKLPFERTIGYSKFVTLAFEIYKMVQCGPIKLPCRKIAELLGVNKETVSIWRRQAIKDGILTEIKGCYYGNGRSEATTFSFNEEKIRFYLQTKIAVR